MKPVLVVLDESRLCARRYYPKAGGGFMVGEAQLVPRAEREATFPAQLEQFRVEGWRTGRRHRNVPQGAA